MYRRGPWPKVSGHGAGKHFVFLAKQLCLCGRVRGRGKAKADADWSGFFDTKQNSAKTICIPNKQNINKRN